MKDWDGMSLLVQNLEFDRAMEIVKEMGVEDNEPCRKRTLSLTQSELAEYRQAKDYGDIMALDRRFFERHCTAIAFTRPTFYEESAKIEPGRSGNVYVRRIDKDSRMRLMHFGRMES